MRKVELSLKEKQKYEIIKKLSGLELREFDHAIIFKVALMVKKYLTANPVKY